MCSVTIPSSEDCLFLNVYAPTRGLEPNASAATGAVKDAGGAPAQRPPHPGYPVLVYFPAGQFMWGSGNDDENYQAPGTVNDTIVITANYRLGALGYLVSGLAEVL